MKIRQFGAELFPANRRTKRHEELTVAVRNFANSPKYNCVNQNPDNIVLYLTDLSNCYFFFSTPHVPAPFDPLPLVFYISMSVSIIFLKTKT